jgi:hypothetical protein
MPFFRVLISKQFRFNWVGLDRGLEFLTHGKTNETRIERLERVGATYFERPPTKPFVLLSSFGILQHFVCNKLETRDCLAMVFTCELMSPDEIADICSGEERLHGKAQSEKVPDYAFRYKTCWVRRRIRSRSRLSLPLSSAISLAFPS